MNILSVPFHQLLNIEKSVNPNYIFQLNENPQLLNHLNTIHACAQLTLAEATSGEFLLNQFYKLRNDVVPVIRKTEVKYQKPANGSLFSKAQLHAVRKEDVLADIMNKGRAIVPIKVELFNSENKRALVALFDWFVAKK